MDDRISILSGNRVSNTSVIDEQIIKKTTNVMCDSHTEWPCWFIFNLILNCKTTHPNTCSTLQWTSDWTQNQYGSSYKHTVMFGSEKQALARNSFRDLCCWCCSRLYISIWQLVAAEWVCSKEKEWCFFWLFSKAPQSYINVLSWLVVSLRVAVSDWSEKKITQWH